MLHPYKYVGNSVTNYVDPLGLGDYEDGVTLCMDRCDSMVNAGIVPCPAEYTKKCYKMCYKDPDYIPTLPDILTPPETKPGWPNWKTWLDAIREGIRHIRDWIRDR